MVYLHQNSKLNFNAPTDEGYKIYVHNPDDQLLHSWWRKHAGANSARAIEMHKDKWNLADSNFCKIRWTEKV